MRTGLALLAGALLWAGAAGCSTTVEVDAARAPAYGGAPALERARSLAATVEALAGAWTNKSRQWAVERRARELGLERFLRVEWIDWWTPQMNVVIEVPGTATRTADPDDGEPLVFVVAHYDKIDVRPDSLVSRLALDVVEPLLSWSYLSSGAVDNATGVAVALEVAREAALRPRAATHRIVLFGAEESGLRGSRCYVAGLEPRDVARAVLAVNIDSVGIAGEPNGVVDDERATPAAVSAAAAIARRRGFALERWALPRWLGTSDDDVFWATSFPIDLLRGLTFNLPAALLPQRSWFTSLKQMPVVSFASPGCFDWTDVVGGLIGLPLGTIHGPRDRASRVDAWLLYEQYEVVRELTEAYARPRAARGRPRAPTIDQGN